MSRGCIHLYTGDGKGKTTAAVGLAVRAAGSDMKVLFVQFLKGRFTGEIKPLQSLGVDVIRAEEVKKFIPDMTRAELEICRKGQQSCFEKARRLMEEYDMLVLDEAVAAVTTGMIGIQDLLSLLRDKPESLEIVLTGREPPEEMIAAADYVSNIQSIKHPYEKGIPARKGIEY